MRAKRPILLYCADPELLSTAAFALRLRAYDVTAVHEIKDAIALAKRQDAAVACGVLLHAQQAGPAGCLIHLLCEGDAQIPLLLVDRAGDLAPVRYADIVLYGRNTSMTHILSALHTLCRRKRGSTPGSVA